MSFERLIFNRNTKMVMINTLHFFLKMMLNTKTHISRGHILRIYLLSYESFFLVLPFQKFIVGSLYLYKYENVCLCVCVCVSVRDFFSHWESDWDTLWHKYVFWPRKGSKIIIFQKK